MQEQFTPNAPVRILRKNPNYWDAGKPKADCLRITVAQEAVAAVSARSRPARSISMLNVDPSVISSLKDDPSVTASRDGRVELDDDRHVDRYASPSTTSKVREAMKLVVDRQAMVDTVLLGFGETRRRQSGADRQSRLPTPRKRPSRTSRRPRSCLPRQAIQGRPEVRPLHRRRRPRHGAMAQVYAEMAKPAGFDINVIVTPAESFWDDVWLKKPIVTSAWSMRPPGEGLAVAYTQNAKWKETHWERPDYDALLLKANTTVDAAERIKLFQQTGELLAKEGGDDPADVRPSGAGACARVARATRRGRRTST